MEMIGNDLIQLSCRDAWPNRLFDERMTLAYETPRTPHFLQVFARFQRYIHAFFVSNAFAIRSVTYSI